MPDFRTSVTPDGVLRGRLIATPDGSASAFLGVPYGVVTARFRRGTPVEPWSGERDAVEYGPSSPQMPSGSLRMNERDCLNLNVWSPESAAAGLPVLVWIHGGMHIAGSNADPLRDGARLAAYGRVVVVSINYRLGALGHLTLDHLLGPDYEGSGNLALADIVSALEWVRDTVACFGGDPANVTVAGQSAGATMVATLLAAPRAAGLFHRAVVQSGDPQRVGSRNYGEAVTAELLELLSLEDDPARICHVPGTAILRAQHEIMKRRSAGRLLPVPVFRPSIDGNLLHDDPVTAVAAGASSTVDLIVGTNVNEASGLVDLDSAFEESPQSLLELHAKILMPGHLPDGISPAEAYRQALREDLGRKVTSGEVLESCVTDILYRLPSQRLLDARASAAGSTRSYLFTWEQADSTWGRRAGHSLELPFLFRHVDDSVEARAEAGHDAPTSLSDYISGSWSAFASNGNPGNDWLQYDATVRSTLLLGDVVRQARAPRDNIRRLLTAEL
jgi:para-nitrobenzyl esterase